MGRARNAPAMPLAIAILMISGVLSAPSVVARQLLIQQHTPRDMRVRRFTRKNLPVLLTAVVAIGVAFALAFGLGGRDAAAAQIGRWMDKS